MAHDLYYKFLSFAWFWTHYHTLPTLASTTWPGEPCHQSFLYWRLWGRLCFYSRLVWTLNPPDLWYLNRKNCRCEPPVLAYFTNFTFYFPSCCFYLSFSSFYTVLYKCLLVSFSFWTNWEKLEDAITIKYFLRTELDLYRQKLSHELTCIVISSNVQSIIHFLHFPQECSS